MKVRKYNSVNNNVENLTFEFVEKKNVEFYVDDMNKKVACCNCGKEIKFGDCYTSKRWFSENGFWGMSICESCHNEELEELKESYTNE